MHVIPAGLGTGIHSGILFLFPHYYKVVEAAERCRHVEFESRANMWFNPDIPYSSIDSQIPCTPKDGPIPSFVIIYLEILAAALIFGVGTAIGEIPPYVTLAGVHLAVHFAGYYAHQMFVADTTFRTWLPRPAKKTRNLQRLWARWGVAILSLFCQSLAYSGCVWTPNLFGASFDAMTTASRLNKMRRLPKTNRALACCIYQSTTFA